MEPGIGTKHLQVLASFLYFLEIGVGLSCQCQQVVFSMAVALPQRPGPQIRWSLEISHLDTPFRRRIGKGSSIGRHFL